MNCPRCGNNFQFTVNIIFSGPMEHWYRLSKTVLRRKDMKLLGVNWDKATILCLTCGFNLLVEEQDAD